MGCCGCSLAASTVTAVVLGLVETIIGIIWNIFVIVVVESHKETQINRSAEFTYNATTTLTPLEAETATDITTSSISPFYSEESSWEQLKLTLVSDESIQHAHIFELSVTALVLNTFWLITTLALAVGNSEKCRDMLKPWIVTTIIITITDIAATIYFIFKAVKMFDEQEIEEIKFNDRFFVENIYVLLATLFSRGGIIIWVANVALCIFVAQRIKEIEVQKKKRMPFDTDLRIGPYTLHSPYEAFETDSYDKGGLRPHTPPPDYEANLGGGYHRKPHGRRPSFPSDCETLPISLRSTSTGGHPRPSSSIRGSYPYPYDDDTVELQHRASIAAENHYQSFAYENRGLDDSIKDGRINIPRPTLKINR